MRVQTERNETARLTFVAEWFHIVAGITHTYQLTFHLSDGGVEVVSSPNHLKSSFIVIIFCCSTILNTRKPFYEGLRSPN